jgi:hypothetical protein
MENRPNGKSPEWEIARMGNRPNGKSPEWEIARMENRMKEITE